ncbi:MAG: hypothetical protein ABEJ83_00290 [Candidatus Nanohaloarchaea archaeon]
MSSQTLKEYDREDLEYVLEKLGEEFEDMADELGIDSSAQKVKAGVKLDKNSQKYLIATETGEVEDDYDKDLGSTTKVMLNLQYDVDVFADL